jgi:DNA-binding response OmpR family regulator
MILDGKAIYYSQSRLSWIHHALKDQSMGLEQRILIIDDSELICQQLAQLLSSPDRSIETAHDGITALETLVERAFSIALIDYTLPGIDGLELIQEIRQRDLTVTPILMTSYTLTTIATDALRLGAYDFVEKPIDPDKLEALINKALNERLPQDERLEEMRRARAQAAALVRGPITFYFDTAEFNDEEIAGILGHLSDLYRSIGGDALVIDRTETLDPAAVLEPEEV